MFAAPMINPDTLKNQLKTLSSWFKDTMDCVPKVTSQRRVPFTTADRERLKRLIASAKWQAWMLFPLFAVVASLIGWNVNGLGGIFFGILLGMALGYVAYFLSNGNWYPLEDDLNNGCKTIFWGQVYGLSKPFSKNSQYYLDLSPNLRLEVTWDDYSQLNLGQKVELHVAP
jgi:hypothetical protein